MVGLYRTPGMAPKFASLRRVFCALGAIKRVLRQPWTEAAFSLVETLICALIVGITVLGVLEMFGKGQAMVQGGGDDRAALSLAEQRLEQVRAAGFGAPTLPDPREETAADGVPIDNASDSNAVPGFRRRTIITGICPTNFAIAWNDGACPLPLTPGLVEAKLVTVMVRMNEPDSTNTDRDTRPIVLSTVLVRR